MTLSIYSAFYNVQAMGFPWRNTLSNWLSFLRDGDQLVLAINTSTDESPRLVREWLADWRLKHSDQSIRVDIEETSISYENPAFDGLIKAAALAKCTEPYSILLDCDEVLIPSQRRRWLELTAELERTVAVDALLIPVVDLMGDESHYRSVGSKFYLHRNRPGVITRGVVKQARMDDGSIDTSKSDTTEPIYAETGDLVRAAPILAPGLPDFIVVPQLESGQVPFVTHLGWLNAEQRVRQSEFWAPHWTARRGGREPEKPQTLESLAAIPRFRHNLPTWRERT